MCAVSVKTEIFIWPFIEKILLIHGPKFKGKGAKVEKLQLFLLVMIRDCFEKAVTFEFPLQRFMPSFLKDFFSISDVAGTILGAEDTTVSNINKSPCPHEAHVLRAWKDLGRWGSKENHCFCSSTRAEAHAWHNQGKFQKREVVLIDAKDVRGSGMKDHTVN